MLTGLKLALLVLQMLDKLFDHWRAKGLIDQGRQEEIAATAERIAVKTGVRKVIWEKVDAMSEEEVDEALADLVRPVAGSTKPVHSGTSG